MAGSRRLKRVSWAPDVSLCKVRLFLSEDAPYQCGHGFQDHLQAKGSASFMMHASVGPTSADSALPPGFESPQNVPKINNTDVSKIPLIKWKPPIKIVLNAEWHVVSGEESEEINKQNNRNFGVLEAIYPRQSTIPPNPSISSEAQESHYNDTLTPLIPLTVIEEEDEDDDPSDPFDPSGPSDPEHECQPNNLLTQYPQSQIPAPNSSPPPGVRADVADRVHGGPGSQDDVARILAGLGAQPDVTAAVSAALTALMRSSDKDSLIDHNLLIKILSDPCTVDNLVSQHATNPNPNPNSNPNPSLSISNVKSVSASSLPPMPPPVRNNSSSFTYVRNPNPNSANPNPRSSQQSTPVIPVSASVQPPLPPLPHPTQYTIPSLFNPNPNPNPRVSQPMAPSFTVLRPNMGAPMNQERDSNYYMTLIQQHGGENGGNLGLGFSGTVQKSQTGTSKIQKPCFYFNSAKGCRHGTNCMFLHDNTSVESIEERNNNNNKRVKVDSNEWYCL